MGRRPSQPDMPVILDEPLDDIGSDTVESVDVPEQPPIVQWTPETLHEGIRSATRINPDAFSDNTFDLMPESHTDKIRDAEGTALTDLEMTARSLRGAVDDDELDEDFGAGDELDDEERNERDFLLSEDEEGGEEAGDEDEEAEGEVEDDGSDELDLDEETPAPKTRKTAADKALEERLAAREATFQARLDELAKAQEQSLAELNRIKAEALAEKQELSLQSERAKQTTLAEQEVRTKHPDLEDLDGEAFADLVEARVSKWESGRREELGKQAAEEAAKADAEYRAQLEVANRRKAYESYKVNLPKGHELMGVEAIEGQGSWADLTAEMHEALSVAGLEVPDYTTFASNFAPMLQAIHQRGFKAGAAKAAQRAARGKSAPPPITGEGGGSEPTVQAKGKPRFEAPKSLANWVPNYFGDMQPGKRSR